MIYQRERSIVNGTGIRFGTSGWRGIISDEFTVENLSRVVQAIANYLKKKGDTKPGLIVGYDTRFMSDRFAKIASNILTANNIPVFLTDRDTPTPAIAFHILKKRTLGAINITASHNPPQYNGIKLSTSYGGPAPAEVTKGIEKEICNVQGCTLNNYCSRCNLEQLFYPRPAYLKHLSKIVDMDAVKKLRIAVDCMYGTSRGYLKGSITLHDTLNPNFGGSSPDPSEERLMELRKIKAQLGLATDGDADRFGIIDRDGGYISTNYILPLIFEHLLKTRKHSGGIVRSMPTTHLLDAIAKKFDREVYEVPVGFKYVGSTLVERNAVMGCEESGGMTIFGHVPEKDGILACLLVAEIAAYNKKSLKELLREMWKRYGRFYGKRIDLKLKPEKKEALISRLRTSDYKILPGDNFKKDLADGSWIMIRPSGTEPIVRCYLETTNPKKITLLEASINEHL